MSEYYQNLDAPAFHYELRSEPGLPRPVRGPAIDRTRPYLAFLGAAQTFGRFSMDPFPARIGAALGLPALNMAVGGAGPQFYLRPGYLDALGNASLVVLQVLSGRSASNSQWQSLEGGIRGRIVATGAEGRSEPLFEEFLRTRPRAFVEQVVRETRADYVAQCQALLDNIRAPTILFWFSERTPDYVERYDSKSTLMGGFPQLVNRDMIDAIRPHAASYVECVTSRGLPQRLWRAPEAVEGTRRHDDGYLYNHYYPSPEMHADATLALLPTCLELTRH